MSGLLQPLLYIERCLLYVRLYTNIGPHIRQLNMPRSAAVKRQRNAQENFT
jgi:hypothetical protein